MKKLELQDVRFEPKFGSNKNTTIFMYAQDLITGKYGREFDFDMFLPSKGKNLQRPLIWSLFQKQQLIISILKGIRVPGITVVVLEHKLYQIIDGKQRLNAISSFLKGDFAIEFNGGYYFISDLGEWAERAITHYSIEGDIYYEYDDNRMSDDDKIKLFEQINFAGTPQDIEHLNNLKK